MDAPDPSAIEIRDDEIVIVDLARGQTAECLLRDLDDPIVQNWIKFYRRPLVYRGIIGPLGGLRWEKPYRDPDTEPIKLGSLAPKAVDKPQIGVPLAQREVA